MTARGYSKESVQRALAHHETSRALHHVSPPGPGQSKFMVRVTELDEKMTLTLREAYMLSIGLACGERHYAPRATFGLFERITVPGKNLRDGDNVAWGPDAEHGTIDQDDDTGALVFHAGDRHGNIETYDINPRGLYAVYRQIKDPTT